MTDHWHRELDNNNNNNKNDNLYNLTIQNSDCSTYSIKLSIALPPNAVKRIRHLFFVCLTRTRDNAMSLWMKTPIGFLVMIKKEKEFLFATLVFLSAPIFPKIFFRLTLWSNIWFQHWHFPFSNVRCSSPLKALICKHFTNLVCSIKKESWQDFELLKLSFIQKTGDKVSLKTWSNHVRRYRKFVFKKDFLSWLF